MAGNKILIKKPAWSEISQYRDFISKAKYKSCSQFSEIPAQALTDWFLNEIEAIKDSSPKILLAEIKDEPIALLSLHKLEWDTAHFGIPMGKIKHILGGVEPDRDLAAKRLLVNSATKEFKKMGIRHISIRLPVDDVNGIYALEREKYYLEDTIVEYYFDFCKQKIPEVPHQCRLRLYQASDFQMIKEGVKGIFEGYLDRFHRDLHLDNAKSDELYEKWMINSCKGLADDCIIATIDGRLAGVSTLVTYKNVNSVLPLRFGEIILSGVVSEFRGKRVYTSMINFGQNYFKGKIDLLRVATQVNNFYVQKAWTILGFHLKYAFHTFHCYLYGG